MTFKESKELIYQRAPVKYTGHALTLLQTMHLLTFRKNEVGSIESRVFTVKVKALLKRVPVQERHLLNLFKKVEEVRVLERQDGIITYKLDLRHLLSVTETIGQVQERKAHARTEAARQRMAKLRAESKRQSEYAPAFSQTSQTPITMAVLRRCFPLKSAMFAPMLCMN